MSKRSLLFICALLVTLWLAFGQSTANQTSIATAQHMPSDLAESTIAKPNVQQNLSMAINNVQSLKLASRHIAASQFDLFATSPLPPEPLSAKLPAQKKPKNNNQAPILMLPPLPFNYVGRLEAGDQGGVLLDVAGDVLAVQIGDVLLNQYKVEAIENNKNGLAIQLLYLPQQIVQTLNVSSGNE